MIFVVFVLIVLIFALVKLCIWLWRKHSIGKAIAILIPVFLCSEIYFSIYPRNSFYEDEFVNISGEKLPTSSKVLAGYASYPDTHGDYTSCAIIEVSNSDYQYLKSLLVKELKAVEGGDV